MKRDIYKKLLSWKTSANRKPLLLQGARQTGKTYILKQLGENEFQNFMYCNFESDSNLDDFFKKDLNPDRIINDLSFYFDMEITMGKDLVIFDEIQSSNRALNSLKYFAEKKPELHIVSAGSLLGVRMSRPGSFPVGKVNFLNLYPLTFLEFLDAVNESRYRRLIENIKEFEPIAKPFHDEMVRLLRTYYFTGGMPEVVKQFADTGNMIETRRIQDEIIKSYVLDFAKHAPTSDIPKLFQIWDSIPRHLAQENKKFVFSAVKKSARARSYENALSWLEAADLILKVPVVQNSKTPLRHYLKPEIFKVYALDVGLLGAMAQSPVKMLALKDNIFKEYKGAFAENYVAQQLKAQLDSKQLCYWKSKGGKAELDFLWENNGAVFPLEVKAGINPKSKSLKSYDKQFKPSLLIRTTLLNFKKDGKICNIPLYGISKLHMVSADYDI